MDAFIFKKLLSHIPIVFLIKDINEEFVVQIFALDLRMIDRQDDELERVVIHTYVFRQAQIVDEDLPNALLAAGHHVVVRHKEFPEK